MKKREYLLTSLIVILIVGFIYLLKGIFPFGDNYVIWGDFHSQITPMYYKIYDAFYNSGSLFIDFNSGGGINFFGILAYYISSPLTLLVLLFPRDMIVHVPSLMVLIRILLCALTCLYFLRHTFKKIPSKLQISLSILYAFSSYNLANYIIPGWIDVVYMLPLIMIGLRKLLDLEDNKMYIITLFLSLIMNFYISNMTLVFILLISYFYLKIYKKKEMKKSILNLGLSTAISILLSCFILIPTILEIGSSIRLGFDLNTIINSGTGPMADKIGYLFTSGILLSGSLMLILKNRKDKFLKLFIPICILLFIPIIIEPINKMLHFGSYVYYPYRYGFITYFMLIIGCAYYFNTLKEDKEEHKKISYISLGIFSLIYIFLTYMYYDLMQICIYELTFTIIKLSFFVGFIMLFISIVISLIIMYFNKNNKVLINSILIITIIISLCNSLFYMGIYFDQNTLKTPYEISHYLYEEIDDDYRIKTESNLMIQNFGMIAGKKGLDHFTSLTDYDTFMANQKLGYDTYWMDTSSNGGNLFTDLILGYKYIITPNLNEYYEKITNYNDLIIGKSIYNLEQGYLLDNNIDITNTNNSFEVSNAISKEIMNTEVFNIINLESNNKEITKTLNITNKQALYLEIFNSYINEEKQDIYKKFNIYVNDELVYNKYPNKDNTNSIYLGTFANTIVDIRIEVLKECDIKYITLGLLDIEKVDNYFNQEHTDMNISYDNGKININVNNESSKLLFIPYNYLNNMKAYNNNNEVKITKVMDNYIGIPLVEGENNITINYEVPGLKLGLVLSIIGLVLGVLFIKYNNFIITNLTTNIAYFIYIFALIIVTLIMYILPFIGFIIGYII